MSPDEPYYIILLRLIPDDFTRQGKGVDTQWGIDIIHSFLCIVYLLIHMTNLPF